MIEVMAPCASEILDLSLTRGKTRTIYLSRHGESLNNLYGKIGGNAELSPRGQQYAQALGHFMNSLGDPCYKVVTSTLQRTQQTAKFISAQKDIRPEIDEINAGAHDNLTYEEIADRYPVEFANRDKDKLNYRYPEGESYMDVVNRLKPVLEDLETENNLLIISHQATIRCLLTLLLNLPLAELPYLKIPLHTVIQLTISDVTGSPHHGVSVEYIRLPVDCVDTHRAKPENCSLDRKMEEACLTIPFHL
eukprot:TRINITY_DN3331_c0_g1_i2.p1 TRINITY_DN3331_c0_g1~~TRINITY_DN3331_c0_g1_i2.p1  ORF type:complete len:249 (+),score=50.53 TRINITY_DN3331_c0_g1_i2:349-1095(+)